MNQSQVLSALKIVNNFLGSARPEQVINFKDNYFIDLIMAGRGFGKTFMGANNSLMFAFGFPGSNVSVVAPTSNDLIMTCLHNPQCGIITLIDNVDPSLIVNRSEKYKCYELVNGSIIRGFSADAYERLRGPQHHYVWFDELAASRYAAEALDMVLFGLRLGDRPRISLTTTPKPIPTIRELLTQDDVRVVRGCTYDNKANLSNKFLEVMRKKYEGTRIGRQELYGEVLEDLEGALWTYDMIHSNRVKWTTYDELIKDVKLISIAIGVDPPISSKEDSDLCGLVVVGVSALGHYYVLRDESFIATPGQWAQAAINLYNEYNANFIIAEKNQGGDMVEYILRSKKFFGKIVAVHASKGKFARAEPVVALYEQNRVHHLSSKNLQDLEDQQTSWVPLLSDKSPDRVDALVWAISHYNQQPDMVSMYKQVPWGKLGVKR